MAKCVVENQVTINGTCTRLEKMRHKKMSRKSHQRQEVSLKPSLSRGWYRISELETISILRLDLYMTIADLS